MGESKTIRQINEIKQRGAPHRFLMFCAAAALSLMFAGTARAEMIYPDEEGTYILKSGASVFGIDTDERDEASKTRGDETPNGFKNTYGYVPLEYIQMGGGPTLGLNSPNLGAYASYVFQDGGISAEQPLTLKKGAFTGKDVYRALAKSTAADINKDGIDEVVYYYCRAGGPNSGGLKIEKLHLAIFDKDGTLLLDHEVGNYTGTDELTALEYSSVLQLAAGDMDGDGCDEIGIFLPNQGLESYESKVVVYKYIVTNGKPSFEKKITGQIFNKRTYKASDLGQFVYSPVSLVMGDISGDQKDELIYSYGSVDNNLNAYEYRSKVNVIQYKDEVYKEHLLGTVQAGPNTDAMGCVSVALADVDADDCANELVVGGYMVNDKAQDNTWSDYNGKKITYYHELAMAFYEWDHIKDEPIKTAKGFTVLREDEMTAAVSESTGYAGGHGKKDTSMYINDKESNGKRCFYPGSSNWTIPLYSAGLAGYQAGMTWDQIFFGSWIYKYDTGKRQFVPYMINDFMKDSPKPAYGAIQENNCVVAAGEKGSFSRREVDADTLSLGKEELLITVGKNQEDNAVKDKIVWEMFCFTQMPNHDLTSEEVTRYAQRMSTTPLNVANKYFEYPSGCVGNVNYDVTLCRLLNHIFMYSEPKIIAALAAPPYFEDVYDVDENETSIGNEKGSGSEFGGELALDYVGTNTVGVKVGFMSADAKVSYGAGTSYSYADTASTSASVVYTTMKTQDSIVLMSIPMDFYNFEVAKLEEGKPLESLAWENITMQAPGEAVTSILADTLYDQNCATYNQYVADYNAKLTNPEEQLKMLPQSARIFQHSKGYPESYAYPFQDDPILYGNKTLTPLNYGTSSTRLALSKSDEHTDGGSGSTSIGASFEFSLKAGVDLAASQGFELTGTAFGSTFNFSETEYAGIIGSIDAKYTNLYKYNTNLLVVKKNLEGTEFPYVTYCVDPGSVAALPKLANMNVSMRTHDASLTIHPVEIKTASVGVSLFELARKKSSEGEGSWKVLEKFEPNSLTTAQVFVDTGLEAGTKYDYRLRSIRNMVNGQQVTNDRIYTGWKTNSLEDFTVTYADPADHAARIFITNKTTGSLYVSSPASIREEDQLLVTAFPKDIAYQTVDWKVTGEREVAYEVIKKGADRGKLLITSWNSDIQLEPVWGQATTELSVSQASSQVNQRSGGLNEELGTLEVTYTKDSVSGEMAVPDSKPGEDGVIYEVPVKKNVQITAVPKQYCSIESWQYQVEGSQDFAVVQNQDGSTYTGTTLAYAPNENAVKVKAVFKEMPDINVSLTVDTSRSNNVKLHWSRNNGDEYEYKIEEWQTTPDYKNELGENKQTFTCTVPYNSCLTFSHDNYDQGTQTIWWVNGAADSHWESSMVYQNYYLKQDLNLELGFDMSLQSVTSEEFLPVVWMSGEEGEALPEAGTEGSADLPAVQGTEEREILPEAGAEESNEETANPESKQREEPVGQGTVSFVNYDGTTNEVPQPITANIGDKISLPLGLELDGKTTGCIFLGWKDQNGVEYVALDQFTIRAADEVLTAVYKDREAPAAALNIDGVKFGQTSQYTNNELYLVSSCDNIKIEGLADNVTAPEKLKIAYVIVAEADLQKNAEVFKEDPGKLEWMNYEDGKKITVNEDRSFYLLVKAEDEAGNVTYIKSNRIVRNEGRPEITMDYAANGRWTSEALPFKIHAADTFGIKQMLYFIGDGSGKGLPLHTDQADAAIDALKDGDYHVLAMAQDMYGKLNVETAHIQKDTKAPEVKITYDKETGKLMMEPAVGASGLKDLEVQYLNGEWQNITAVYEAGYQAKGDGRYQVRVTNQAGVSAVAVYDLVTDSASGGGVPPASVDKPPALAGDSGGSGGSDGSGVNGGSNGSGVNGGSNGSVATGDEAAPVTLILLGGWSILVMLAVRKRIR